MAREKIDISVDADVARAIANLTEVVRAQEAMGQAAGDVGAKGAKGAREWANSIDGLIGKYTTLNGILAVSLTAIKQVLETQEKLRGERVDATQVIDTGTRNYRIAQGNLSEQAGLQAASRITAIAQQTKSTNQAAFAGATLLAKFGVGREEAEGSALTELLTAQDVAEAQGNYDPSTLSKGILEALNRFKQPITGENIRRFSGTAFGLSQKIKGFDAGEIGITADVATMARERGLGMDETAAMVGVLSEAYGEGGGKKRFKSLFKDGEFTLAERDEVAKLRRRARGVLSGTAADYETATNIAGGGMEDSAAQAQSGYEASGFEPGILDAATVRKRYLTARRNVIGGTSAIDETLQGYRFDWLNYFGGPEYAVNNLTSGFGPGPVNAGMGRIRDQALGRQEITVRLQTTDGRDIPTQSEAEALNTDFSNDATQSSNFRP